MQTVLAWLDAAAARCPDTVALADETAQYTYAQWRDRALALAAALPAALYGAHRPIGVLCDRTAAPLVGFMAVAYSGNFYLPLDAATPPARLAQIAADSGMPLLLGTDPAPPAALAACPGVDYLCLAQAQMPAPEGLARLAAVRGGVRGDDALYMVYTSGSTGRPKGVVKTHRAVRAFIESYCTAFDFAPGDVWGSQAPYFFDAFAKDLYTALALGARLEILPQKLFAFPVLLIRHLNARGVTVISWAPSAMTLVARLRIFDTDLPQTLRWVLFVGEVLPPKTFNYWRAALPGARFANTYGFSEIAGVCLAARLDAPWPEERPLPLGRPLPGAQVLLLDDAGRPLPLAPGAEGELCVHSPALACGYWNDPARTAAAFAPLPGQTQPLYRSGDRARLDADDCFYFAGRRDLQIKHMGHRIELEEIEAAALRLDRVQEACCLYDARRDRILLAYAARDGAEWPRADFADALRALLPEYMIPTRFVHLAALPRNANGKLDRPALADRLLAPPAARPRI